MQPKVVKGEMPVAIRTGDDAAAMLRFPSMDEIFVRPAVLGDAETLVRVHRWAVETTAGPFYPLEIIQSWAAPESEKSYEHARKDIADPTLIVLVGETGSNIGGFGIVAPATEELRGLFVHPDMGRHGVGTAILANLEQMAVARGVKRLNLDSSINAEAFYARHGYEAMERAKHPVRCGHEMDCIRMSKRLSL